ncbi:MAG: hypothetical protein LBS70_07720 [Candidatus Accumulibacter sp.]|nr:hypothetical protein [Accumulibacter sp.]
MKPSAGAWPNRFWRAGPARCLRRSRHDAGARRQAHSGDAHGGSCRIPLGAYARLDGDSLLLRGFIASADGRRMLSDEIRGAPGEDEAIGRRLADSLLARGAGALLAEIEA